MPRGDDFTARWTEGAWAELKILEALNRESNLIAVQYGITDGEAFWSSHAMAARELPDQTAHGKRPDVLVFERSKLTADELALVQRVYELDDPSCEAIVRKARLAIESEFSPYNYGHRLENYGVELSFTIKEEDLEPTKKWRDHFGVEIGITQVFLDRAYLLPVGTLLEGIANGSIKRSFERSYRKYVYYPRMSRGIEFGVYQAEPTITAEVILSKHGKYTAFRRVTGGSLNLTPEMLDFIK